MNRGTIDATNFPWVEVNIQPIARRISLSPEGLDGDDVMTGNEEFDWLLIEGGFRGWIKDWFFWEE